MEQQLEGLPKKNEHENSLERSHLKEGVSFVFEQSPGLASIGTQEQYSEYLDTVFPDSADKNIWYHGAKIEDINEFKPSTEGTYGPGIYFMSKHGEYFTSTFGNKVISVIVDAANIMDYEKDGRSMVSELRPEYEKDHDLKNLMYGFQDKIKSLGYDGLITKTGSINDLIVFEPKQIHILGSEKDIESFRDFVSK